MSEKTNIAWCDSTLNFWSGCTKVSDGCKNCYAETLSNNKFFGGGKTLGKWGKGAPRKLHESAFKMAIALNRKPWICDYCGVAYGEPFQACWNHACPSLDHEPVKKSMHRRRIFSLSLGDWLDDEVLIEWFLEMLFTVWKCDQCVFILCSKRYENWRERMEAAAEHHAGDPQYGEEFDAWLNAWIEDEPPKNIILLASVENQAMADKRIPELLKIPAACRGLSLEPLLGAVNLDAYLGWTGKGSGLPSPLSKSLESLSDIPSALNWLIIGGESGKDARPCNVDWIRSLVEQGKAAGVATFVKQLGSNPTMTQRTSTDKGFQPPDNPFPLFGKLKDKKGGDISEWPTDLQIQQWPVM